MFGSPQLRFLNAGHFCDHYFLLIFPTAVIAIQDDWQMDYGEALALGTPAVVAFALGTLLAGWLGDRWSRRSLMAIFFVGIGLASIVTGLAEGPVGLATGLALIGLFAAIYHPVALAMITDIATRPGRALAVNGVFGNLGLAGATLATGWIAASYDWRAAFLISGAVAVTFGVLYCIIAFRDTATAGGKVEAIAAIASTRAMQIRVVAAVLVFALLGGLVFNAVTISLPKLFDERLTGIADDLSQVGEYAALVFAIAAFAQLPVGDLLDRFGARIILITLFAAQFVAFVLIADAEGAIVVPLAIGLVLMMFAELPVTAWLVGRYVSSHWRARAFSVEYLLSLGVSSAALPAIAALHHFGFGFDKQYLILAGCVGIAFVVAFLLPGRPRVDQIADQAISDGPRLRRSRA
ncbi:MAG: MFS transporter [Dongiaceae bacterium]